MIEELHQIITLHNVTNEIMGEKGFVFRKIELKESIFFIAYLDIYHKSDKMEIVYLKNLNSIEVKIHWDDKDYLNYMLQKFGENKKCSRATILFSQVVFSFNRIEDFRKFMLDDFEEFMMNYNMVG